ncbi:MAG: hypothetical protein ACE5FL_09115, partial [Myxococcota bacterium]
GSHEIVRLPAGEYLVEVDSEPRHHLPITLASEESVTLTLTREGDRVGHHAARGLADYRRCEDAPVPAGWEPLPASAN